MSKIISRRRVIASAAALVSAAAAAGLISGPAAGLATHRASPSSPKIEAAASARIPLVDALEQARGAVYIIGSLDDDGGFEQIGTGFAVRNEESRGLIATNGHVADAVNVRLKKQVRVVVRRTSAEGPTDLPLTGAPIIHPGYERWHSIGKRGLAARGSGGYRDVDVLVPADVALLPTAPGLPSVLDVASAEQLENLKSGENVVYLGFPAENIYGQTSNVPATAGFGHIQSLSGIMFEPSNSAGNLVISHDLQLTGGSSGGPLLMQDSSTGRLIVIGAHNAGSHVILSEARIPVAKGYAQRADYIRELLDGNAAAAQDVRDEAWAREVRGVTLSSEERFRALRAAGERNFTLTEEAKFSVDLPRGGSGMVTTRVIEVREGETYIFAATGANWDDIDLRVSHEGETLGEDKEPNALAAIRWSATYTGTLNLTISAPTVYGTSRADVVVLTIHEK